MVSADPDPPHARATEALLREWSLRRGQFEGRPSTVFFGGGTPSRTPPEHIARVRAALDPLPGAEISLEANPEDLDTDRLAALADAGVDRLSLGVQSFLPSVARRLGRTRSARGARAVVEAALSRFRSVSVDLIFAAPGQRLADFEADLDQVLDLGLPHVSLYGLCIEEGTPFARAGYVPAEEDLWADMYQCAVERLGAAGVHRYEVSNFAREGHRCRHNEHYWRARSWAGLGPGAHAWWPDGTRAVNLTDIGAWLAGPDPLAHAEKPAPEALAAELIGSTLRHVDGLDLALLARWTGRSTEPAPAHVAAGLVTATPDAVVLREPGFAVADGIAAALCDRLRPARGSHTDALGHTAARRMPPKRPPPPPPVDPAEDGSLEIEIDPALLEAALASVEKHLHHKPAGPTPELTGEDLDVEISVESAPPPPRPATSPPPPSDGEAIRLKVQAREAAGRARALEEELLRMTKLRDHAEAELREVRRVAREAQADFDRIRARTRKDREEAERATEERLLREVLETGDNLERAWQHAMSDPESLLGGLQMIVEQFRGVLRRLGVERIDATPGAPFDPEVHEAVMHVRSAKVEAGAVVDEVSPGYRLRGRLFRPARVTVASPP